MWIQLLRPYRIVVPGGRPTMHEAGEMLRIKNKGQARKLIRDGFASNLGTSTGVAPHGCGVAVRRSVDPIPSWIDAMELPCQEVKSVEELPYELTIMWDGRYLPSPVQMIATFRVLNDFAWEMAVPIKSYAKLVKDIGSKADQARTKRVIHDLRVPYYNTHLLFVRSNGRTREMVRAWYQEQQGGGDDCLAFMRALYQIKPIILALPAAAVLKKRL